MNKLISKGGLIGALIGGLICVKTYKENEPKIIKVGRSGLFIGIGYFLGQWFEKKPWKR